MYCLHIPSLLINKTKHKIYWDVNWSPQSVICLWATFYCYNCMKSFKRSESCKLSSKKSFHSSSASKLKPYKLIFVEIKGMSSARSACDVIQLQSKRHKQSLLKRLIRTSWLAIAIWVCTLRVCSLIALKVFKLVPSKKFNTPFGFSQVYSLNCGSFLESIGCSYSNVYIFRWN